MSSTTGALQHQPFFEALAACDESSPAWRGMSAGFVTLRLFDAWMMEGRSVIAHDGWGVRSVREAIHLVGHGSAIRALLTSAVDAMEQAPAFSATTVAPRLMAYARALQFDGQWALAADVYRTVLVYAQPVDDADVLIAANMNLGACLRVLADFPEAHIAYTTAAEIATLRDDVMNVLRARVAEANLAADRGNLPRAELILDETITRAAQEGLRGIQAVALHDRSVVARRRGDGERAVSLAYEALEKSDDQSARDRVLSDLAATFFDMGLRSAARDAHLVLAATAQEQYVRWAATINLLEIAAMDEREPVFEQYRRELVDAALPASLAAHYHYYVGQGYRMFQRLDAARSALRRAIEIATQCGLNQVLIQAEESLSQIGERDVLVPVELATTSPRVTEVATAVRRMRSLVGVAD